MPDPRPDCQHTPFGKWKPPYTQDEVEYKVGGGVGASSGAVIRMRRAEALGHSPSDITKSGGFNKYRDNLLLARFTDFPIDNSTKPQALDQMEMGEEKYPKWKFGKSSHTLRAWVVHSTWASIENVCKISSCVLVNKLQCEHIVDHFKVTGDVLKKLGLDKDFVSGQALEGGSDILSNFTFNEVHFIHIVETFEDHLHWFGKPDFDDCDLEDINLLFRIQNMSSMFEDYIHELRDLDGSNKESLSKKQKFSEDFKESSARRMSAQEIAEAQSRDHVYLLDEFLCSLFRVLKQGEDLVLFHSGLEGANNAVVEWTGLYGEKFVQIHKHLYKLFDFYGCLEHCKGTEFARGYISQHDSCRAQSLLYYLNSNCLGENASLSIDVDFLNIKLGTTLSQFLKRPNCVLKTLFIEASSGVNIDQVELWEGRLMVIAALSKCVSITSLSVHGLNGEEVHELCKGLSIKHVLENLVISTDGPLANNNAMDLFAILKENHSLKSFTLKSDSISPEGATYFGAMLAENSSLEELTLQCSILDNIGMKHFMWPLMTDMDGEPQVNLSLKHLRIDTNDEWLVRVAEIIAQLLRTNKTLTHFSMDFKYLNPNAICEILDSLKKNRTLQVLDFQGLSSFYSNYKVGACLETMLTENSVLEELKVNMSECDALFLKHLLRPLMANEDGEPHINNSLRRLHIVNYEGTQGWEVAKSIAEMLRTNKALSHFSMINASLESCDVCVIVDSLKINKALQVLNLEGCKGLDNAWVEVTFMDVLVNYNFTLSTIKMLGRDWDIEAFMKSNLEQETFGDLQDNYEFILRKRLLDRDPEALMKLKLLDSISMAQRRLWSLDDGISESTIVRSAHNLKETLEDFQLERGEGSSIEVHGSSLKVFEELQEELAGGCFNKPKVMLTLKLKLEMESEQSLQELKLILESVMKSTNFLLRRNLNMAQLLQEKYTQWDSFSGMNPSKLTDEEKDELSKGCIIASLFPTTFLYHLKACLLQGPNPRGILHTLEEVVGLVVQRVKSLQDSGSQTFKLIDYNDFQAPLDVQHIYSPGETIAICQTFSTNTGIGEELQAEDSIYYGIVQEHLSGAYYFDSEKASNFDIPNLDKSVGVIGVKVTSTEVHIEIMWEDGSYYSGALEDFSYILEPDDNNQCALEAFGDLKGAHFFKTHGLKTHGLKCSPLLVIALAMAIHKKGLALTWRKGKGHIEIDSTLPSLELKESEVWECQILYSGDINQLGETMEWGMNQFDQNCASSRKGHRNNQCPIVLEHDVDQNGHISNTSNDAHSHTRSRDLSAVATQFNVGAQNKQKFNIGVKVLGSGGDIGFEKQNSKGKKVEDQAFEKMQELHWEEKGGYVIGKLDDRHELLEEKLYQGSLYAERDLNYLAVHDDCMASHFSMYLVKEQNEWIDDQRLELEWITDIFIEKGPEKIKSIFKGLKGETLEVTRTGIQFLENPLKRIHAKVQKSLFKQG